MIKAVREAKVFTNWLSPNSDYENALVKFLDSIMDSTKENNFLEDFLPFEKRIAYYGALNSLSQVLLKVISPGVPDFYQGTELWDLSLVDPDNRRPVGFETRVKLLAELTQQEVQGQEALIQQVLNSWKDGRIKLYITYKALGVRKSHEDVLQKGEYIPLQIDGQKQEHVLSFARCKTGTWVVVIIPRLMTKLSHVAKLPTGRRVWGDGLLLLPEGAPLRWHNIFTGENLQVSSTKRGLNLCDILRVFPIALLINI
jgi:(1->4)-alpha-D-glucan 1-alpha-D-glucosylmutase